MQIDEYIHNAQDERSEWPSLYQKLCQEIAT